MGILDIFKALLAPKGTPPRRHYRRIKSPATTIRQAMRRGGRPIKIVDPARFLHSSRSAR